MASISDLFQQAKALHDERVAWLMDNPPDPSVMRQVEELKKIGHQLIAAYKQAGGTKVQEHEHVEGSPPHCRTTPPVGWEYIITKQIHE